MKKVFSLLVGLLLCANAFSQEVCWVFFTDKAYTTFDPYSYFDAKAIERYRLNHADLYDSTNFPLNAQYCESVANLSDDVVGESRWLNAMAVVADENAIKKIQRLPFVKKLVIIQSDMNLCSRETEETIESGMAGTEEYLNQKVDPNILHAQLKRMGGEEFVKAGTRGKGIRIAVLDGGFPMVDKHEAFQHLRDNHQILKTYNFPKKCENVYGWNSHGTMTLSCICGLDRESGCAIGLATEAEFLLARTEVGPEPKKEEVWWVMGVEWADKNGAQLISSSLGYGNINHWPSETDGTSPISKAANMAVEKGILICNSAGNEGTKRSWPGIILPADAENVLTVGGINPTNENHQDFASYGPTADGRLKPNVSAYAFECRVAAPNSDHTYKWVAGTSFSCPLVAGFAACAWQNHPEQTALQLKREIEKCADLYPYYDYAVGYGVPQAGRFLNPSLHQPEKTFDITQDGRSVYITPHNYAMGDALHYHIRRADGRIYTYRHVRFDFAFPGKMEINTIGYLETDTLCVWYKGYCENIAMPKGIGRDEKTTSVLSSYSDHKYKRIETYAMGDHRDIPSTWGNHAKNKIGAYVSYGILLARPEKYGYKQPYSDAAHVGLYYLRNVTKTYGWGISIEAGGRDCNIDKDLLNFSLWAPNNSSLNVDKATVHASQLDLEFYQHFRLSSGYNGLGCALEIGIFGSWIQPSDLNLTLNTEGLQDGAPMNYIYKCNNHQLWDYGMTLRVNYSVLTLFAKLHSDAFFGNGRSWYDPNEHSSYFSYLIGYAYDRTIELGLMMKF